MLCKLTEYHTLLCSDLYLELLNYFLIKPCFQWQRQMGLVWPILCIHVPLSFVIIIVCCFVLQLSSLFAACRLPYLRKAGATLGFSTRDSRCGGFSCCGEHGLLAHGPQ